MKLVLTMLLIGAMRASAASLLHYWPGWWFAPMTADTFSFPTNGASSFPAFIVQTNTAPQSLVGKTLSATFRVNATADAVFRFGGQDKWNTGTTPPHARLFFSTRLGYDAEDGCPKCSWYSADGWQVISNGTFTVTATLDPDRWTDSGARPWGETNSFAGALTNVIEVGLCFGGGSFYDIGVALTSGAATFTLTDLRVSVNPLTLNVESSPDLANWSVLHELRVFPTNASGFFRVRVQ